MRIIRRNIPLDFLSNNVTVHHMLKPMCVVFGAKRTIEDHLLEQSRTLPLQRHHKNIGKIKYRGKTYF